jgi:ATP-binding cassette subfamily C protein
MNENKPHFLWNYLHQFKNPLLFVLLIGFCLVIPNLALPAIVRVFVDKVLLDHSLSKNQGIILGTLLAIFGIAALTFLQSWALNRLKVRLSTRIANDVFWHMLRLPMSFFMQRYPGEIAHRLRLSDSISETLTGNLAMALINTLFAIIFGIVILFYNVKIGLTAITLVACCLFIMKFAYRSKAEDYLNYRADLRKTMAYSLSGLQNIETIKASGMEIKFFSRWAGYYTNVINTLQQVGKKDILLSVLAPLLHSIITFVLIGVGVWEIINSNLSIGMFVALQMLLINFINPVMQLMGFNQTFQLLKIDTERLNDIFTQPIDSAFLPHANDEPLKRLEGHVVLRDITFGYHPSESPIFDHFSLTLSPGKSVALVGPTGCGKSTIAKIIAGLFTPWSGEIAFDGTQMERVPRKSIIDSLSLVEQDSFLFNASVMENLTLFDRSILPEEVFRCARDACIHEDILSRPGGYDMEIRENGSNLSEGQKQKLEIARALIKNPTILILDEATSALNGKEESEILKNIRKRGCAVLLITHSKSTIRECDEVVNVEGLSN